LIDEKQIVYCIRLRGYAIIKRGVVTKKRRRGEKLGCRMTRSEIFVVLGEWDSLGLK